MFISNTTVPFRLDVPAEVPVGPESIRRVLLVALGWVSAATVVGILVSIAYGFVIGFHNAVPGSLGPKWSVDPQLAILLCGTALQAMLLWAAWRRARVVGRGNRSIGLGWDRLQSPALFAVLAIVTATTPLLWSSLLIRFIHPGSSPSIAQALRGAQHGWLIPSGTALLMMAVAPAAEELFFRGWLWTALRRHWGVPATAVATALPWLLMHLGDGLYRPLFLIPAAIVFTIARQTCGGVRASLLLHVLNNSLAVAFLVVSRL